MNPAVEKTLALLLLITIGSLLRSKLQGKPSLLGVKVLILSVALPAMIFVAILKIDIQPQLLFLPILALAFNLIMFAAAGKLLPWLGLAKNDKQRRTLQMLFPSLAPGLSCFPFLIEYLGEESLALGALADVGNKVFGLILLYLLAMHWYYRSQTAPKQGENMVRSLLLSLVKEPINLMIIGALVLLSLDIRLDDLPAFFQQTVGRLSGMMTTLILLFIGMAVKLSRKQIGPVLSLLTLRSGLAFGLAAIALLVMPGLSPILMLTLIAFPQSSCSFWPYAHMATVERLEEGSDSPTEKTFDTDLALTILAYSLPFSTILILTICSVGTFFANPLVIGGCAVGMIMLSFILKGLSRTQPALRKGVELAHRAEGVK